MINVENLVFLRLEDQVAAFERSDGTVLYRPFDTVPSSYKEGDIIKSIVHSEDNIEFIELNKEEMVARHAKISPIAARIRRRAKRSTNLL